MGGIPGSRAEGRYIKGRTHGGERPRQGRVDHYDTRSFPPVSQQPSFTDAGPFRDSNYDSSTSQNIAEAARPLGFPQSRGDPRAYLRSANVLTIRLLPHRVQLAGLSHPCVHCTCPADVVARHPPRVLTPSVPFQHPQEIFSVHLSPTPIFQPLSLTIQLHRSF